MFKIIFLLTTFCISTMAFAKPYFDPSAQLKIDQQNVKKLEHLRASNSPLLQGAKGVMVTGVVPASQAEKAGIEHGDIIVSYDGVAADTVAQTIAVISSIKNESRAVRIRFIHAGKAEFVDVRTGSVGMHITNVDDVYKKWLAGKENHLKQQVAFQSLQAVPDQPMLRLETGVHISKIHKIDVDARGRYMVSSADDKTLRLWSLPSGKLIRTFRHPINEGDEGKLYATAISPNAELIATAGHTGVSWDHSMSIYIYSRKNAQMLKRLSRIGGTIHHLKFSPDGRYLAASLAGGLQVWRTSDWATVATDYGYAGPSHGADFSADGRLLTTSMDGYIRLYDKSFKLQLKQKAEGGEQPYSIAFSPNGQRIVVGFMDSTEVNVLSSSDLSLLYEPDNDDVEIGNLQAVSWSADGQHLYAGGEWRIGKEAVMYLRHWLKAGRGDYDDIAVSSNTVVDIKALPNGNMVLASGEPAIAILDTKKFIVQKIKSSIADYRDGQEEFLVSHDGSRIQFGTELWGKRPFGFDLTQRQLIKNPSSGDGLHAADTDSLDIDNWKNTRKPELNDEVINLPQLEVSRSLAIAPDQQTFVLGTSAWLRSLDKSGRKRWIQSVPGEVWAVNISGDGKLAVAALSDGTIRWYRYRDGELLLSFFPHKDGKRWLAWTPEGFFEHSEGAEKLVGYHFNQGKDKSAKFVSIDQVYDQFYRPDLVAQKLSSAFDHEISIAAKKVDVNRIFAGGIAPTVKFLSPKSGSKMKQRDVTVRLCAIDEGGGMGRLVYRLNGVVLALDEKGRALKKIDRGKNRGCGATIERTLTLQPGNNTISVTAYNKNNEIESRPALLKLSVNDAISDKPSLHILSVGVNKYRDKALWLNYAVPDGKSLVSSLKASAKSVFEKVQITEIYDARATLSGVEKAFNKIASTAKSNDVFILYLAGHGITLDGTYHFLPVDFRYRNEDSIRQSAIDQNHIQSWMAKIPALKNLVLLDTCNSGSFVKAQAVSRGLAEKTAINKLIRATGRAVISASSDTQVALEGYKGHGVFTYALLQAMKQADNKNGNRDGVISTAEIASYIDQQVPDMTYKKWGYEQVPQVNLHGREFPVGVVQ